MAELAVRLLGFSPCRMLSVGSNGCLIVHHSRLVSSATPMPVVIGVATARIGDAKIGCGSAKDQGMMNAGWESVGIKESQKEQAKRTSRRSRSKLAIWEFPPSLRHSSQSRRASWHSLRLTRPRCRSSFPPPAPKCTERPRILPRIPFAVCATSILLPRGLLDSPSTVCDDDIPK